MVWWPGSIDRCQRRRECSGRRECARGPTLPAAATATHGRNCAPRYWLPSLTVVCVPSVAYEHQPSSSTTSRPAGDSSSRLKPIAAKISSRFATPATDRRLEAASDQISCDPTPRSAPPPGVAFVPPMLKPNLKVAECDYCQQLATVSQFSVGDGRWFLLCSSGMCQRFRWRTWRNVQEARRAEEQESQRRAQYELWRAEQEEVERRNERRATGWRPTRHRIPREFAAIVDNAPPAVVVDDTCPDDATLHRWLGPVRRG